MCKPKSEGGRRCPIHRYDSMAIVRVLSRETGMPEKMISSQLGSLSGGQRVEKMCDPEQWNDWMREAESRAKALGDDVALERLKKARKFGDEPTNKMLAALDQISTKITREHQINRAHLRAVSRQSGRDIDEVTEKYYRTLMDLSGSGVVEREHETQARRAVYEEMMGDQRRVELQNFPTGRAGWCDGRLEIVTDSGARFAYHGVTEEQWKSISSSSNPLLAASAVVKNHNRYLSEEQADEDAYLYRCARCGQFASSSHACDVSATATLSVDANSPAVEVAGDRLLTYQDLMEQVEDGSVVLGLEDVDAFDDQNPDASILVVADDSKPGVITCLAVCDESTHAVESTDDGFIIERIAPRYEPGSSGESSHSEGSVEPEQLREMALEQGFPVAYPDERSPVEMDGHLVDTGVDYEGRGEPTLTLPNEDFFCEVAETGGGCFSFGYTEHAEDYSIRPPLDPLTGSRFPLWRTDSARSVPVWVEGTVAVTRDADGEVRVVSDRQHLQCGCYDYRQNSDCEHVNYIHHHMPAMVNRLVPQEPTNIHKKGFPWLLGRSSADGSEMDFSARPLKRIADTSLQYRLIIPDVHRDKATLSEAEIADLCATYHHTRSMTSLSTVSHPSQARETLTESNVKLGAEAHFNDEAKVTGTLTFGQSETSQIPDVLRRDLKCTCPDYAENYDCKHVRVVVDQRHLLFDEQGSNNFSITGYSFASFKEEYAYDFEREAMINTRIEGGLTREEAEAAVDSLRLENHSAVENERIERFSTSSDRRMKNSAIELDGEEDQAPYEDYAPVAEKYRAALLDRHASADPEPDAEELDKIRRQVSNDRKKGRSTLEFATANVLSPDGGPSRRFGVELEFQIRPDVSKYDALRHIGQELHAEGLTTQSGQQEYHQGESDAYSAWTFEHDDTVDGEIVSPVLNDDEESWKQLEKVCEVIKRNGGVATVKTGGHVHVSSGTYGFSAAKYTELARMMKDREDVLYRLASNPHSGRHRGMRWCPPNIADVDSHVPAGVQAHYDVYTQSGEERSALNLKGVNSQPEKDHVEFRLWDGSLDPAVIQQQIKISAAMVDRAEVVVEKTGASEQRRSLEGRLGSHRLAEDEFLRTNAYDAESFHQRNNQVVKLVADLFPRAQDRTGVLQLFCMTRWQKV